MTPNNETRYDAPWTFLGCVAVALVWFAVATAMLYGIVRLVSL